MMNPNTTPFLMLDGTPEYQQALFNRLDSETPLETITDAFERMGIKMPDKIDTVEMDRRGQEFLKRYHL